MKSNKQNKYANKTINVTDPKGQEQTISIAQAINYAYQLLAAQGYNASIKLVLDIYHRVPKFVEAANLAAYCYITGSDYVSAQKYVKKSLALERNNFQALMLQATIYRDNRKHPQAIKVLDQMLNIFPRSGDVHLELGLVYRELGDDEKTLAYLNKAIELEPNKPGAYAAKARIPGSVLSSAEIKNIERMINTETVAVSEKFNLLFSLARSYEEAGDIDQQMACLEQGNALKRSTMQYDIGYTLNKYKNIKQHFDKTFIEDNCINDELGNDLIFIFGFARSGTTLTEQIVASHAEVSSAGEIEYLAQTTNSFYQQLATIKKLSTLDKEAAQAAILEVRKDYLAVMAPFKQAKYVTDKSLVNFQNVGLIKTLFPKAKLVHTHKHPVDTCLGCYKQIFKGNNWPFIYNLDELEQAYRAYHDLMKYWDAMFPGDIFHLSYESLVQNQESVTRDLLAHCGLEWDENCLNFHQNDSAVQTVSALQVRQKLYADAVGRWEKYSDHLEPLLGLQKLTGWS